MPNLLDCPQEIQDMIYKTYFRSILTEDPHAPVHRVALLRTSRRVATDAVQVSGIHLPLS